MTFRRGQFIHPAIILIILCILVAGCTSKTDVQPSTATPFPTKYSTKVLTPVLTPSPVTLVDDGSKTCNQVNGTVAVPGQVCPGRWLTVSDSFSCCSQTLVVSKLTTNGLTVEPLDLRISHNATFVEIGTG